MVVHYFTQRRDLIHLSNNWLTRHYFKGYLDHFPQIYNEYTKKECTRVYIEQVIEIHDKHFKQWKIKYVHSCLPGDMLPASQFTNWILGRGTLNNIPQTYNSAKYKSLISLPSLLDFLTEGHTFEICHQ